jgi:hypothetical protein
MLIRVPVVLADSSELIGAWTPLKMNIPEQSGASKAGFLIALIEKAARTDQ